LPAQRQEKQEAKPAPGFEVVAADEGFALLGELKHAWNEAE